jgi:hypothetical protein
MERNVTGPIGWDTAGDEVAIEVLYWTPTDPNRERPIVAIGGETGLVVSYYLDTLIEREAAGGGLMVDAAFQWAIDGATVSRIVGAALVLLAVGRVRCTP